MKKNKISMKLILPVLGLLICTKAVSQEIKPTVLYKIVSPAGLVIDNRQSAQERTGFFLEQDKAEDEGQLWQIRPVDNGYYSISNPFFDKSPDNNNGNEPVVRRLGLAMVLPQDMENIRWYGRVPHENYSDRKTSAFVGQYNATVKEMEAEHYVRAQSMGNREDIRRVSFTNANGRGIKISTGGKLSFSALHFPDSDLWNARHDYELDNIRKPEVYVSLDCIQQGVGNASCGPLPLKEYMILENTPLRYSFRIEPF